MRMYLREHAKEEGESTNGLLPKDTFLGMGCDESPIRVELIEETLLKYVAKYGASTMTSMVAPPLWGPLLRVNTSKT